MIAVDTNILVYAHRSDSPFHSEALEVVSHLGNGTNGWAIPWPCIHEFINIATHPKIYHPPTEIATAFQFIENWMQSPSLHLLGEGPGYVERLKSISTKAKIAGPKIHDARIAAICIQHGIKKLYTADRDFSLFPELKCTNPLVK